MRLTITHTTSYAYDTPVSYALQKVRLRPLSGPLQDIANWDLEITGGKIETSYVDHYGNHVDLVSADIRTHQMTITATGTVETRDTAGVLGKTYGRAPLWHFQQASKLTQPSSDIEALSKTIIASDTTLNGLHDLSSAILKAVPYQAEKTHSETSATEAIAIGHGVCQDHAHIMIAAARLAGLPARYVSGYLMMNDRVDQDASHAWAEVHLDDLGWVGFDVSNGVSPDEKYVRIATGRDAHDAAPVSGLRMGDGDETLIVSLQVQQ
ncbi:transglutaminase family protein [Roseovarius sp. 2305UL8-3]|uniref:transglutaminase family protein n=1 Tax=Roseovarius conchicola TaxID=3121636 RepID=UPI003528300C